jgi:hypothetical protein
MSTKYNIACTILLTMATASLPSYGCVKSTTLSENHTAISTNQTPIKANPATTSSWPPKTTTPTTLNANYIYPNTIIGIWIKDMGNKQEQYIYAINHKADGISHKYNFTTRIFNDTDHIVEIAYGIQLTQFPYGYSGYVQFPPQQEIFVGSLSEDIIIPISINGYAISGLYLLRAIYWMP